MTFKQNTIVIFNAQALAAFPHIERVFADVGTQCVLTSGLDGSHSENSLHYQGRAWDFRSRDLKDVPAVVALLKKALDPMFYDVVLEGDHIHIEYDPKQRRGL